MTPSAAAPSRCASSNRVVTRRQFLARTLLVTGAGWVAGRNRLRAAVDEDWIPLFNGKNLDGWTPKITGFDLGDNHLDTYRVENGLLRVVYDRYEKFDGKFGHLFYKDKFSHYRIRVEYRFVGQQTPGGPGWAFRNSGVMLHCQAPESMAKKQEFPVSIEVQLLGGDGTNKRSTANLCTPGTHVVLNGKLHTPHCTDSTSKTYHGDQWVTVEIEVQGHSRIRHLIEGQTVLEYTEPQLDDADADAKRLLAAGAPKLLGEGWISLQAESHPVEFRKVELLPLKA
ncbi:MAG: DUF1080 domain-containing protein [Verrucomicrobia bacterium]|nr:DUF1080 domain-containing protein [Verrucomicrobiota bacterium]